MILRLSNFPDLVEKEQFNLTSTGLIINETVWVRNLYVVPNQISHKQSNFESLRQYYFGILLCLGVQSHPEDHCDFGQGSTVNI